MPVNKETKEETKMKYKVTSDGHLENQTHEVVCPSCETKLQGDSK